MKFKCLHTACMCVGGAPLSSMNSVVQVHVGKRLKSHLFMIVL